MSETTPMPAAVSPIADLSYRNYDGPRSSRRARWWIVALATIRLARNKPVFWILVALNTLPSIFQGFVLYVESAAGLAPGSPFGGGAPHTQYALHFFQALAAQGFLLFLAALLVGAGSIASDNRANALQVYLSKPITKGDYLLGKWMGIALVLFAITVLPALLLYLFCLASFLDQGFWRDDPLLIGRLLLASGVAAAVHASLLLGCSAWSKTPRMAGAAYAGLYFTSSIVARILGAILAHGNAGKETLVSSLSVGGIAAGLAQNIYHVSLGRSPWGGPPDSVSPPPSWAVLVPVGVGLVVAGVLAARARIRAVEVIRG